MAQPVPAIEVQLPPLTPGDEDGLTSRGEYDGVEFRDLDLTGRRAYDVRLLECGLFGCRLDETSLRGAQVVECRMTELTATSLDLRDSRWREVELSGSRFGALDASGAAMTRVRIAGCKVDFVNARAAGLDDVWFEDCRLGEVDLGSAECRAVHFVGCEIERVRLLGARLRSLDLSRSRLSVIEGIADLSGAVLSETQVADLAGTFADHLGVTVVAAPRGSVPA